MRGLYKSTGFWQTQAAKGDWIAIAEFARQNEFGEEVEKLTPPEHWGWRRIDKRIAKLQEVLSGAGLNFTLPSAGGNTPPVA